MLSRKSHFVDFLNLNIFICLKHTSDVALKGEKRQMLSHAESLKGKGLRVNRGS